ncbi:hypothetical protein B0T14DRAFT_563886 [Immersiella caudata]|uniref:NB-ARC domain-containing protein n=1 Tax=Immersiella caudata TaxID=314043 RepID=A0AA39WVP0_9PEZI|nr:hypothetical protein B0T14DRAFT_563886 [Immersiella caudata]
MSSSRSSRFRRLLPVRSWQVSSDVTTPAASPSRSDQSAIASEPQHTNAYPQGLEILTEGVDPVVDIVAVHGLNGHRSKTWAASNGVLWLRDLLPLDIPNARMFSWGYDANTHAKSHVSCKYLYDHARTLVSDLCRKRKLSDSMERPIIFIAHSLGGLVVKSALIHSDSARKGALQDHRSIKVSTYGIIFMGTPHQGGSGVQLGRLMVNVASLFVAADDRLLRHLERDSEWLQQQLGQFSSIGEDFVTKFAFESYETPTFLGRSIMVVPRASAVVSSQANAEAIPIAADHREMVRYRSRSDEGYTTISEHLQIMIKAAPLAVHRQWEVERRVETARNISSGAAFSVEFALPDVVGVLNFVARSEELAEIHAALENHQQSRKIVVVHGLGGMGKTQIAAQYAKCHKDDYSAIFWLNAKDETSLKQSYSKAASRILQAHPSASSLESAVESGDLDSAVRSVKQWLNQARNSRWLMIYDNYDTPSFGRERLDEPNNDTNVDEVSESGYDIRPFLPETHHGAVLVTTRSAKVSIGRRIKLGKLKQLEDSLKILSDASGRQNIAEDAGAVELARELDGLPLALVTAGAYLDNVATTFSEYLEMYRASWLSLQKTTPDLLSYEDRALYSTWNMSYRQIEHQSPPSAMLLRLLAYFDNEDVWFELLQEANNTISDGAPEYIDPIQRENTGWLLDLVDDVLRFNKVVRILCDYSLLEADISTNDNGQVESPGYSMHACVHSWTRHVLNREFDHTLAWIPIHCVALHMPSFDSPRYWELNQRLIRHAGRCYTIITDKGPEIQVPQGGGWAFIALGALFMYYGSQFNEAEEMYRRALNGDELSPEEPVDRLTMRAIVRLGWLHRIRGDLAKAEIIFGRALQAQENFLGPESDDEELFDLITSLGHLYSDQGRFGDAMAAYQRVLEHHESTLGSDDYKTLLVVNDIGDVHWREGRLNEARIMCQRALRGHEKKLGADHVETLHIVHNLAAISKQQGFLGDSENMYKHVLQGYEATVGPNHRFTLATVHGLAWLRMEQGSLGEAEALYKRAKQGYERLFGIDGVRTNIGALDIFYNLADLYEIQGRISEARELFLLCREGYEAVYGKGHEEYLDVVKRLADLD